MNSLSDIARKTLATAIEDHSIYELMESNSGLCFACGNWTDGYCEPDARNYKCYECGRMEVFGAEEAIIYL